MKQRRFWSNVLAIAYREARIVRHDRTIVGVAVLQPMILLVIFGSIFGNQDVAEGVSFSQYFLAGMIASGIMNTGFQSLALGLSADRDLDILKRLHGTPLPTTAFFAGKFAQVLFVSVVQLAVLIARVLAQRPRAVQPMLEQVADAGEVAFVAVIRVIADQCVRGVVGARFAIVAVVGGFSSAAAGGISAATYTSRKYSAFAQRALAAQRELNALRARAAASSSPSAERS